MTAIKVSSKYQVVISQEICESLNIRPGQEFQVVQYENRIELIPVRPVEEMRGFLKGINTTIEREPDRL